MSSKVCLFMFTYLFIFISCLSAKTPGNTRDTSGPYTIIPIRIRECEKPTIPYLKERMSHLYMDFKNTIITGNLTIYKEVKNLQTSVQDMFYEDGRWQVIFYAKKLSCRASMLSALVKAFGVSSFDKKNCAVPKGTYIFNKIEHLWTKTREYGRVLRRMETTVKGGTFSCYELEAEVRPKTT